MDKGIYGRRDRLVQEKRHDTYKEWEKWPEPTVCTECKAVFTNGRWSWTDVPEEANKITCPACQRIAENYPAGRVELQGAFLREHWEEILNLIKNEEKKEKGAHPMERIMNVERNEDNVLVTTTGVHMARRIGEALARAYQGELEFQYGDAEKTIRVYWKR